MKTDTAHLVWNERWATADGRADWLQPEEDVVRLVDELAAEGRTRRVLDLGCGVGRHALHLARAGFETHAIDMAEEGLSQLRGAAADAGLSVHTAPAAMTALPFPDEHFDYVLAFNVIYHGDAKIVRQAISEIRRVLRSGGVYQGTMLSKRNTKFGKGTEIAPNTFIEGDASVLNSNDDKNHPHFYCNAAELIDLFAGFELRTLTDKSHSSPGSYHWHLAADRL